MDKSHIENLEESLWSYRQQLETSKKRFKDLEDKLAEKEKLITEQVS